MALETKMEQLRYGDLRLLPKARNARYMEHEKFRQLVENIKRDGCVTQAPFALYDEEGKPPIVLSGNHRVMAAIEGVGADHVDWVQTTDNPMTAQEMVSRQLSHNSIVGEDDPAILARLYEELEEIDWREFSGLDDKSLGLLDDVDLTSISEANLDFQSLTVTFLPEELERAQGAIEEALAAARGSDAGWIARLDQFDETIDALDAVQKANDIRNAAAGLALILAVFRNHATDLQDAWLGPDGEPKDESRWVPVSSVVGWDMPAGAAHVLNQAVRRMVSKKIVEQPWQALEMLAADFLAGPDE